MPSGRNRDGRNTTNLDSGKRNSFKHFKQNRPSFLISKDGPASYSNNTIEVTGSKFRKNRQLKNCGVPRSNTATKKSGALVFKGALNPDQRSLKSTLDFSKIQAKGISHQFR